MIDKLIATLGCGLSLGLVLGAMDERDLRAKVEAASEAAASRRQAITAQCHADGGYPLIGERVYCMRRWAHQGEAVVIWERDYR